MANQKGPSPNDQRSNVKNPNNDANRAAQDNRANQLNPNHAGSKGSGNTQGGNGQAKGGK